MATRNHPLTEAQARRLKCGTHSVGTVIGLYLINPKSRNLSLNKAAFL